MATIPRKLHGLRAPSAQTPRKLRWIRAPRAKIPRPSSRSSPGASPGPSWGPLLGPPKENPAKTNELVETSSKFMRAGRGTRETSSEFLRAGRSSASRSGLQTPLFVEDSAKSAPHPLFYEGKRGSADPVIYRGSEMGGALSSSGHARNALFLLKITLYLVIYRK